MLRSARVLQAPRLAATLSARLARPGSQTLRLQSTAASESAQDEAPVKTNEQIQAERQAAREAARKWRNDKMAERAALIIPVIEDAIANGATAKELFSTFSKAIENEELLHNSYYGRVTFGKYVVTILNKSIAEISDPNTTQVPPTPEEVLAKAAFFGVADVSTYETVVEYLFKEQRSSEVLAFWVSYLEYSSAQRIKYNPLKLINYTILAYLDVMKDSANADPGTLLNLLQTEELPPIPILGGVLKKSLPKNSDRYRQLNKALQVLGYHNKNPNSIQELKVALEASRRGDSSTVFSSLNEIRRISKITGATISEETIVAFMTFFSNLNMSGEVYKLWNELIKSGIKPSTAAWNALLDSVSKQGQVSKRAAQVEAIQSKIPEPNEETTAKLIEIYTRLKVNDKLKDLITTANLQNPAISQAYLKSLAQNGDFTKVKEVISDLAKADISVSRSTYNQLLARAVKGKKDEEIKFILNEMHTNKIKPDVATFTIILDFTFKSLRAKGEIPTESTITSFFQQMKEAGIDASTHTVTAIIDGLGRDESSLSTAQFLFRYLQDSKKATAISYVSIISNEFALGRTADAERHFKEFVTAGFPINSANWAMVFEGWYKNGKIQKAKAYLDGVQKLPNNRKLLNKFSYYYLLRLAVNTKDLELANQVLRTITENQAKSNVSPQSQSLVKNLQTLGAEVPEYLSAFV